MLEETTNIYKEDKTTETAQQTLNSFERGERKWQQDKAVEKQNTNLHAIFYWTT